MRGFSVVSKSLGLGLLLIAAASAALLLSDLESRTHRKAAAARDTNRVLRVALVEPASIEPIKDGAAGFLAALADRGYYHGRIDGQIGPMTMAALVHGSDFDIAMGLHQKRAQYMIHRATWSTFADGWENRLAGLPFIIMQAARTL